MYLHHGLKAQWSEVAKLTQWKFIGRVVNQRNFLVIMMTLDYIVDLCILYEQSVAAI